MSGLRVYGGGGPEGSVPLVTVDVKAAVVHAVGQVEITQVYRNDRDYPIETVYFFPLDSCGAVTFFQAEFDDGTIVKGTVKTKEDAEKEYKKAVEAKKTAFLGEQVKPDIFNIKVGHLNPGVQVKVLIGYVTEVKNDPDTSAMRFVLPTTVAPRYTPPGQKGISDGSGHGIQHRYRGMSPTTLSINLAVSMEDEIVCVKSPSHTINAEPCRTPTEGNWNKWIVTLACVMTELDRDFVVLVTLKDISKPRLYSSVGEDGSLALMAHLIPNFKLKDQKSEFVIVIDRSGSMGGNSIRLAKQAVTLFLHSLPEDCYFNVVGFGSSYVCLFPEGSRKYDGASLREAMIHSERIEANLGGTEIAKPLLHVLSRPLVPEYVRQVFVLTDGEVSNTEEVIGIVKSFANQARVFSLGIGTSASAHLVRGIANAGGGTCAFVESDDNIQKQTLSQLKNSMQPALTDVSVKWVGIPNEQPVQVNTEKTLFGYNKPLIINQTDRKDRRYFQAPVKVSPIFDGTQLVVVGVFEPEERPTGVVITAVSPDGPLSIVLKLDASCSVIQSKSMLHKLAAVKVIQELEAEETYSLNYGSARGVGRGKIIKAEICELGLKYGIASKYTSFVAVREESELVTGEQLLPMRTAVVGSLIPAGFGHFTRLRAPSSSAPRGGYTYLCLPVIDDNISNLQCSARDLSVGLECQSAPQIPTDWDRMLDLVKLQSYKGSFKLTKELCDTIGLTFETVRGVTLKSNFDDEAFATCLVLVYLKTAMIILKDQWELVAMKGNKWLLQNCSVDLVKVMACEATIQIEQREKNS